MPPRLAGLSRHDVVYSSTLVSRALTSLDILGQMSRVLMLNDSPGTSRLLVEVTFDTIYGKTRVIYFFTTSVILIFISA